MNVYFAGSNCVFKLNADGVLSRIAGTSLPGYSGDGGPATSAQLQLEWDGFGYFGVGRPPAGLALDGMGNLFIADVGNFRIRRISLDGIITTVAGIGTPGFSGDGGPAVSAQLSPNISGLAVDGAGNLFIADSYYWVNAGLNNNVVVGGNRIRRVSPDGIITTVAGNGKPGFSGDGGPATEAQINYPTGLGVDSAGNLYFAEGDPDFGGFGRVRRVSPDGIITTIAGNGAFRFPCLAGTGDGGPAAQAPLCAPSSLALDAADNVFFAESGYLGDPGLGYGTTNFAVRKISPGGTITTVAGADVWTPPWVDPASRYSGDGGPAIGAAMYGPLGIAVDGTGNLFISDRYNSRIRKVSADGTIVTVAGDGICCFSGDGGPAMSARLSAYALAWDGAGNLFISDRSNYRVRKISSDGVITTVAGNGTVGFSGDGGPATSAQLNYAIDLAADGAGNLYTAEQGGRVRRVSADGIITTVAGNGTRGFSGDGGPATSAQISAYVRVAGNGSGELFIADANSHRVRKVSRDGTISTVAGNGAAGSSGDGGPATSAQLTHPQGMAVDRAGNSIGLRDES